MLTAEQITFRYPGHPEPSLNDVTLSFEGNSNCAFMGASGSGKTTFAKCLKGLLLPDQGCVKLNGIASGDPYAGHVFGQGVGLVFQQPGRQLAALTVARELAFGLEQRGMSFNEMDVLVNQFLELFRLEKLRDVHPWNLSGGEKQKLAIASVLILHPQYLILDEPASFLSPASRETIVKLVYDAREQYGTSVLNITQSLADARCADRLVIFSAGRVAFDGPPPVALNQLGMLRDLGINSPELARVRKLL